MRRFAVIAVLLLLSAPAATQQYKAGSIHIMSPWSRALPPTSENGAAYFILINQGDRSDRLLGVLSPIAKRAEIHRHTLEEGIMKMRHLKSIALPPGEEIRFRPGEHHIMLIQLNQPLKEGNRFPLMLHFDHAGDTTIEVVVQPAGAEYASQMQHDHENSDKHEHQYSNTTEQGSNPEGITTRIDLQIRNGEVVRDNKTVRVIQGNIVELHWSSDQTQALNLHGYDIKIDVTPDSATIMRLQPDATERFPAETHGSNGHNTLIYLEVHPK